MAERPLETPDAWAKPLRSYRLRGRPLTEAQQAAYGTLPQWGFPVDAAAAPVAAIASRDDDASVSDPAGGGVSHPEQPVDLAELFGRMEPRPVAVEIGFGMAETTLAMAIAQPEVDLIAVDVHRPGVAVLLKGIAEHRLTNIRVARGDAVEILSRQIAPGALDEVRVFFPDPWPKAHHHRRRLVNAEFAALVASRMRIGGRLHLATDWEHYAQQMRTVIAAEPSLDNTADTPEGFVPRPAHRPVTRFEEIGMAKGHEVFDLVAVRVE